jgi:hypothetical protein
MNSNGNQFQNVRVLPKLGVGSDNRVYNTTLPGKKLSDSDPHTMKATRWDGPRLEEVTAVAGYGTDRVQTTGKTPNEARQKAHNASSTKKTQEAKSGKRAKTAMAQTSTVGEKKVIKINTDPAKGK